MKTIDKLLSHKYKRKFKNSWTKGEKLFNYYDMIEFAKEYASQQPTLDREKVEEIIDRFISWDENEEAVIHWRKFPELADAICC